MIRRRPAPTAVLTANSCCRAVPRASSRIETFPHPITSSNITAPKSKYSVPPMERNDPVVQSLHMDPEDVGKILRHVIGELFHERLQRRVGCGMADARPQEQIDDRCAPRISQQLQREIDVAVIPSESRRRDAYDLEVPVIKLQSAAHDIRVGQVVSPPKPVGKNCNRSRLLAVHRVGWPKSATKQRGHAEILEIIRDEAHGVHRLRKILPGQHQSAVVRSQNAFDHW